jgi:dTDP-4-dehydrorhamnose reductase
MSQKHHVRVYYISTGYVFSGINGEYKESDSPNPCNWYGFTKYAGKIEIQRMLKNYCIIRTSFRLSLWPFPTAYTNVLTSADYTDIIAREINDAITYNMSGIIHIGTKKKLSLS